MSAYKATFTPFSVADTKTVSENILRMSVSCILQATKILFEKTHKVEFEGRMPSEYHTNWPELLYARGV